MLYVIEWMLDNGVIGKTSCITMNRKYHYHEKKIVVFISCTFVTRKDSHKNNLIVYPLKPLSILLHVMSLLWLYHAPMHQLFLQTEECLH